MTARVRERAAAGKAVGLLTREQFRRIRDEVSLASMRERLPLLHIRADEAWAAYQVELADVNTTWRGKWTDSCRDAAMEWQRIEADIANTEYAIPEVEARLAEPSPVVKLFSDLMETFGYKKAVGE